MNDYIPILVQLAIALISGGAGWLIVGKQRRKIDSESRKVDLDGDSVAIATVREANEELRKEFNRICTRNDELHKELEDLTILIKALQVTDKENSVRISTLEGLIDSKDKRIVELERAHRGDTMEIAKLRERVVVLEKQLRDANIPPANGDSGKIL